jgi:hypothetical protein
MAENLLRGLEPVLLWQADIEEEEIGGQDIGSGGSFLKNRQHPSESLAKTGGEAGREALRGPGREICSCPVKMSW